MRARAIPTPRPSTSRTHFGFLMPFLWAFLFCCLWCGWCVHTSQWMLLLCYPSVYPCSRFQYPILLLRAAGGPPLELPMIC